MPDAHISLTPETRDYLNIAETSNRSRLAVSIALARRPRLRAVRGSHRFRAAS